jgi:hypothetical protein
MQYCPPTPRWTPLAARLLFATLMGASLAACGNDDPAPAPPLAQQPAPGAADPARACSAKSANMRCAP